MAITLSATTCESENDHSHEKQTKNCVLDTRREMRGVKGEFRMLESKTGHREREMISKERVLPERRINFCTSCKQQYRTHIQSKTSPTPSAIICRNKASCFMGNLWIGIQVEAHDFSNKNNLQCLNFNTNETFIKKKMLKGLNSSIPSIIKFR